MKTTVLYYWEALRMQDVGPGDADVYTKSGRHTSVKVKLTAPIVETSSRRIRIHAVYDVIEGRSDYTHLQLNSDIVIPIPNDWTDVKVQGVSDFNLQTVIYGKNHRWNPVDVNSSSYMQSLELKIDGPGDDNEGNAGLRINFAIPVEYQLAR